MKRPLPNAAIPFGDVPPAELPSHLRGSGQRLNMTPPQQMQSVPRQQRQVQVPATNRKSILSFPSDKNGCGFYRTIIPFNYLISKHEYDITELFTFVFDLNYITRAGSIRFQRQVTDAQIKVMSEYRKVITKCKSDTKLIYEVDDLVHEIEPSNIIAYQFYTNSRKNNLVSGMNMCDKVTVSTDFLKDYYQDKFNVRNIHVIPNYLPKFLWGDKGKRDKSSKEGEKPRILWAGSASHVGKGGDLEFLMPLIKKTKKEFQWVFFGVLPPELTGQPEYEFHEWADFWSYPAALDAINADLAICPIKDTIFNYAKSDLKVLEYTALGLPSISSAIGNGLGPYDMIPGICTVDNDADNWYQAIKDMAESKDVRDTFLAAGQNELNQRWLENPANTKKYLEVYK